MKTLKLLSLTIILGLIGGLLTFTTSQAQTNDELQNMMAEFEMDDITTESLGIETPTTLSGDTGYWWVNLKRNLNLFFTFNQTKKALKEQNYASELLLEAKQLAEQEANSEDISNTLNKYQQLKERLTNRVQNNEQVRNQVMNELDDKEFKHLQLVREISDKVPEEIAIKLTEINKENAERWFETHEEQVTERLIRVIEQNNTGSKYQQFRHLATLEELSESLPADLQDKLEIVKIAAQEKLADKLTNSTIDDKEKIEKYIDNVNLDQIVKEKIIQELQYSKELPLVAKTTIDKVASSYAQRTKEQWNNMNLEAKKRFLAQFANRYHPSYLEFLNSIEVPAELKKLVQELKNKQEEGIRNKIQQTNNIDKLNSFQDSLQNSPTLRKQIQERKNNILEEMPTSSGEARPMVY